MPLDLAAVPFPRGASQLELLPGGTGAVVAVAVSSVVFGLSHLYQGRSGAPSTALIGSLLGALFIGADYNLWLPIITHGVIDTVASC